MKAVKGRGLGASVKIVVYPTILHYLKAVCSIDRYSPNTVHKLLYRARCIKGFIDTFDVHATVNQGHRVEAQVHGGQLSITEMVRVCRRHLDNAGPLPAWASCSYHIAPDLYRMVLKETYELYDPHFSVRHESTPPTLDQKKTYSTLLNTVGFNFPTMHPFVS